MGLAQVPMQELDIGDVRKKVALKGKVALE